MKKILILILISALVNNICAQSKKTVTIPLYQEGTKLDSLFSSILQNDSSSRKYFVFYSVKGKYAHYFYVFETEMTQSSIELNLSKDYYNKNLRFFKFRNCTVFVNGDDIPFKLVYKTNVSQSFDFIWNVHHTEDSIKTALRLFGATYVYKNGRFAHGLIPSY